MNNAETDVPSNKYTHPEHYTKGRKYEPKDIISMFGFNFNLGNAVKYISRAGRKQDNSAYDDITKAYTYILFEDMVVASGKYKMWYPYCNTVMDKDAKKLIYEAVVDDWKITDSNISSVLYDLFSISADGLKSVDVEPILKNCEKELNAWRHNWEEHHKYDPKPITEEWIFGWNNAMKDVIRYVESSSYYSNQDDIINHCKEAMITFDSVD